MATTIEDQLPTNETVETDETPGAETDGTEVITEYKTIGERLESYNVTLTNATSDQGMLTLLQNFNYTKEKIDTGKSLLEIVRKADARNAKEYGEQYAATEKLEKEFKEATKPYMTSLGVARIAFKQNPEAKKALVTKGSRSRVMANWIRDADVFYRNVLSTDAYLFRMADFGRTREMLEAEYKEVKDVQEAYAVQKKEMGDAVESTTFRDARMAELDNWMADFIGIAHIALQDNPDSVKKLGL